MTRKDFIPVLLVPVLILMIPLSAMVFKVEGWAWGPADFIIAWIVMISVGFAYKWVTRRAVSRAYRFAAGIALAAAFLLFWINGAVGLIGNENNPANLLYGAVIVVGLVGAALARFSPSRMVHAMFATAFVQLLVPVVAFIMSPTDFSPGVLQVFVLNFVFVLLFVASALLFRHAANHPSDSRRRATD